MTVGAKLQHIRISPCEAVCKLRDAVWCQIMWTPIATQSLAPKTGRGIRFAQTQKKFGGPLCVRGKAEWNGGGGGGSGQSPLTDDCVKKLSDKSKWGS